MSGKRCIYCSPDRPAEALFTREHVIPEAFGMFRNNLVLNEGVCHKCNQFFGDNLERIFGRGSAEGIFRLDYRIKPPESVSKLQKNRVSFSLNTEDDFNGLILEYGYEDNDLVVLPVPQVAFPRRNGRGWIYVAESDLADLSKPLSKEVDTTGPNILIFNSEDMKHRLIQVLADRNIEGPISEESFLPTQPGQQVWVEVKATIDSIILRCVAKIAFNYLAQTAGIDFVVKEDL